VVGCSGRRCFCRRALITLHWPGSANAVSSVCLYRKQERPLRGRPIVRPCLTARLCSPFSGCQLAIVSHRCVPSLWTRAPETWLLPAVSRAYPPATSTDCPVASDGGGSTVISRPAVWGLISHCASPVTIPPYPPAVLRRFGRATAGYVDRSQAAMGSRHLLGSPGTASCPAGNRPPSLRAPVGDPTPITPVKGTYSGEIESLDRDPGIATLDPGMRFPGN